MSNLSEEAREARRQYMRQWRKNHPEKVREYERRRWEKLAGMDHDLMELHKKEEELVWRLALMDESTPEDVLQATMREHASVLGEIKKLVNDKVKVERKLAVEEELRGGELG